MNISGMLNSSMGVYRRQSTASSTHGSDARSFLSVPSFSVRCRIAPLSLRESVAAEQDGNRHTHWAAFDSLTAVSGYDTIIWGLSTDKIWTDDANLIWATELSRVPAKGDRCLVRMDRGGRELWYEFIGQSNPSEPDYERWKLNRLNRGAE